MDEMMMMRMMGAGFGTGVDLAAVIAFVAFAIVTFLAPVLGYQGGRSRGMIVSLYLLIGYVAMSIVALLHQWYLVLEGGNIRRGELGIHFVIGLSALKLFLFGAAMLSFTNGVRGLHMPQNAPPIGE